MPDVKQVRATVWFLRVRLVLLYTGCGFPLSDSIAEPFTRFILMKPSATTMALKLFHISPL